MIISSSRVLILVIAATLTSCIKRYAPPTHESLLIWTDTEVAADEGYSILADDLEIGTISHWDGGHGCDSSGYIVFQLPISDAVTFKLQKYGETAIEIATIQIYPGSSGANIKAHNEAKINMDSNTHQGCTLLQLDW